jgi:cytochrome c oxidase subunit II
MSILPQASTFASRADQVFLGVFLVSLAFLVFITGLMIYFVVRYARRRHPKAEQIEGHVGLEITWTIVPLGLFLAIFYFGWTNYDYGRRAPRDAMVVRVTGRQWSWSFQYPNGKQTSKLYAALNRPMKLQIHSADVIHGFYVPAFRIKADAVPGRTNTTWFQATELGSFDIECTVICGVDHSAMLSQVEVIREDDFKAWYFGSEGTPEPHAATLDPPTSKNTDKSSGDREPLALVTLRNRGCLGCHSLDGAPMAGPTFKGLYGKREELGGTAARSITIDEDQIALAIREPSRDIVRGFPPMPQVHVEPDELKTIVDYLKQLQ